MASINKIMAEVRKEKPRSIWGKGVKKYAIELLENVKEGYRGVDNLDLSNYQKYVLNGAKDWKQYSYGGMALIYNRDIAKRLCTKAELVKTHNGDLRPNAREDWLDVQARALRQADMLIRKAIASASTPTKRR